MDWLPAVIGSLTALGGAAAAGWAWYTKARDREQNRVGRPYKDLFKELRDELKVVQDGFNILQAKNLECEVKAARQEERIANLEREVRELRAQSTGGGT